MVVSRYLVLREGHRFRARRLTDDKGVPGLRPHMHGEPPPEVRQVEGCLPIAPVGGADELKQGFVFRDGQRLALAEHPANRREVAGEYANFTRVWAIHGAIVS